MRRRGRGPAGHIEGGTWSATPRKRGKGFWEAGLKTRLYSLYASRGDQNSTATSRMNPRSL